MKRDRHLRRASGAAVESLEARLLLAFSTGDQVTVTTTSLNVRSTAAGAVVGTQPLDRTGRLIGGPTVATLSGTSYTWYNIDWDTGVDGWSVDDYLQLSGPYRKGVDYSYARPSPTQLKAAGYQFAVRYFGGATSKQISSSEAAALRSAGLDILTVYESSASRMLDGFAAGVADANTAISQAAAAGAPANFFCYFACDFDATAAQQTAINAYLDGAVSVMGLSRVGLYGGYYPIQRALDAGKASKGWQTTAWSAGLKDPRISLYQYQYNQTLPGDTSAFDINDAYGNDIGQWSVLTVSAADLSLPTTTRGIAGATTSFTVTAKGLANADQLTLGAPTGMELSLSAGSGFATSLVLTATSAGNIASTTVYARTRSTATANVGGNLTFSDAQRSSVNQSIAVAGTVLAPEVSVTGNAVNIVDGDTTPGSADGSDFGAVSKGGVALSRTFRVSNAGPGVLAPGAPTLPAGYTITEGLSASIPSGGFDDFTVALSTATAGTFTGQISFANNDSDENPFNFAVSGIVRAPQSINFPAVTPKLVGQSVTLAATSNSGLAVTYTLVSGQATLSGNVLTVRGIAPLVVRAAQAGDATRDPATAVDQTVQVSAALAGDADLDRVVGLNDLLALANHYGQSGAAWAEGDFDGDGTVGLNDLLILSNNYGSTLPAPALPAAPAVDVPLVVEVAVVTAPAPAKPVSPVTPAPVPPSKPSSTTRARRPDVLRGQDESASSSPGPFSAKPIIRSAPSVRRSR